MDERERYLALFREVIMEKILDERLDWEFPRTGFLFAIIEFREKYSSDLFSKFTYLTLVQEFIEAVGQYVSHFDLKIDFAAMENEMIPWSLKNPSPSWATPTMMEGACLADHRHRLMLGDDY